MGFSERLKILRNEKNLTQQQLADDLKLGKSTISMYENNKREPDFETMELIADYFNVDMNYLYGKTKIKNQLQENLDPRIINLNKRELSQYEKTMNEASLFFQDEKISEEDKQKMLMALNEIFFRSKEINKEKYKKKTKKDDE